jgi:GMP synthase-like glutamine amidotransferase
MRAHYLQHVPFEGLGSIEDWLRSKRASVTATKFFENGALPPVEEIDLLVVMGGPMSVNDEARLPWLAAEKRFIRQAIHAGKPVVGICLGAQLIASAMGARVYPAAEREIGWLPVRSTAVEPAGTVFALPAEILAFHWHGETFDLPGGAMHLARSAACEHQAFQLGRRVIALQFHLETTPESVRALVENCRDELVPSRYVQSEARIVEAAPPMYRAINAAMRDVLEYVSG